MLTTDPIYFKPYLPKITIKSLDNLTTYYTYDPWTDVGTTNKPLYCTVSLSRNSHGSFVVQIEDEGETLNRTNISLGARLIVECGKQSSQMTRIISGLIRGVGDTRGSNNKIIYTITGSSTGIRNNERILYFKQTASTLPDGVTLDTADVQLRSDQALARGYSNASVAYPLRKDSEDSLNIIDGLVNTRTTIQQFMGSIGIEFGELQDLANFFEDQTGGVVSIDINDLVQFQHESQPVTAGRGFTIKNVKGTADDADDTCYLRGKNWDYSLSCLKSDNYSSRIYSVMAGESLSPVDNDFVTYTSSLDLNTTAVYQKFKPTRPHPEKIYVFLSKTGTPEGQAASATFNLFVNLIQDSGGVPGGGISYRFFRPVRDISLGDAHPTAHVVQLDLTNTNPNYHLDITKDWWIGFDRQNTGGFTASHHYNWMRNTATNATIATSTTGGAPWTVITNGPRYAWTLVQESASGFECSDYKARAAVGLIESTLTAPPATVTTRYSMYKYMTNEMYNMACPRANYNMATVTAPNIPIIPGDPIIISDSILGFSVAGSQSVITTCGDMTYTWGQMGRGDYEAPTILNIIPVGIPTKYK